MAHALSVAFHNGMTNGWDIAMGLGSDEVEPGLLEDASAAFIVRVWIEAREIEAAPVEWRGSIEHVGSGEIKYLSDLDEIVRFIRSFLEVKVINVDQSA